MTEWLYKATPRKVTFEETSDLAHREGFLCRSAFEDNGSHADNTRYVEVGDVLHFYFTGDGPPRTIGTFEVIEADQHSRPDWFGELVSKTVLYQVKDDVFAARLRNLGGGTGDGYQPDPVLKRLVGWVIRSRADLATPPYSTALFPNQGTLRRHKNG